MTVTTTFLATFTGTNGANPVGSLITDSNGDLIGTTLDGGASGSGTVFEIAKTATGYASLPATLVNFNVFASGANPKGGLIADANGDLFGTAFQGGAFSAGTVFEIAKTTTGYASTPTTLVSFNGADGAQPFGSLIADANGDLFGTTGNGGANNVGTVFEITKTATGYASTPITLVSFNGPDGATPTGSLIADANGDLFGTTSNGGAHNNGTVFEIAKTAAGYASTPTTLVSFNVIDGAQPLGNLIADANGDLFGTTSNGGASGLGTVFEVAKTAAGYASTSTTLVSFNGINGLNPEGSLIADANGDLFGTTAYGGPSNVGTVFEVAKTAAGYASTPITLVSFTGFGANPLFGSLIADANGDLFGTTANGGAHNNGTVFEITGRSPTGVSLSPVTISLAGAQLLSGLAANAQLATVTQVGGQTGDSFTYTLSGASASAFNLTSTNNVGMLSTGASGAPGGKNGKLYALTLTANDTTTGASSPASPLDVVVGSGGKDTVSLATLVGSLATDLSPFFPPVRSRILGCCHADRDGVSRFGRARFLRPGHLLDRRRAQPGSRLAAGHRRSRRAAVLTQASTAAT